MSGLLDALVGFFLCYTLDDQPARKEFFFVDKHIGVHTFDPGFLELGPDQIHCGLTNVTLDAGTDWTDYLWSDASTSEVIVVNSSDSYAVTVSINGFCPDSDEVLITIDIPVANLGDDRTICEDATIELGVYGIFSQYNWSNGSTYRDPLNRYTEVEVYGLPSK